MIDAVDTTRFTRLIAGVAADNPASARVLEKTGFALADARDDMRTYHITVT